MKRFFSGILIVAMLSQPSYLVYGAVALTIDKNNKTEITYFINEDNYSHFLDGYFDKINSAADELHELLNNKNALTERIDATMSRNAREKIKLNDSQIYEYKQYMNYKEKNELKIRSLLYEISDLKKLSRTQMELLKTDTDFGVVITELAALNNKQAGAIALLKDLLLKGDMLLSTI